MEKFTIGTIWILKNLIRMSELETTHRCQVCNRLDGVIVAKGLKTHACQSCGSIFFYDNGRLNAIEGGTPKSRSKWVPEIFLGKTCTYQEIPYTVVGIVLWKENKKTFRWADYVLFNPYHGYLTLVHVNGHWTIFETLANPPVIRKAPSFKWEGHDWKRYMDYSAKPEWLAGSFPFAISYSDLITTVEYASPPFLLSQSKHSDYIGIYKGEYLEPAEVKALFNLKKELPKPVGMVPNSPNYFKNRMENALWLLGLYIIGATLLFFLLNLITPSKDLLVQNFPLTPTTKNIVSEPFKVKSISGYSNLQFHAEAPVDQSWLYMSFALVDEVSGKVYYFDDELAYYYGHEDGEKWSEGSSKSTFFISSIPDGYYRISLEPQQSAENKSIVISGTSYALSSSPLVGNYYIQIKQDVPVFANLMILLIMASLYPLVLSWLSSAKESRRRAALE
jgi:hypothetical protein